MLNFSWIAFIVTCLLSAVIAVVSMTITQARIFMNSRKWMRSKNHFLGDLLSCPYCTSHWVSAALGVVFTPRVIVTNSQIADVILSVFLMVALAAPWCKMIHWAYMDDDYGDEDEYN